MRLFKNTNYDFSEQKWPVIIASLVLTSVAGFASIIIKGGLDYGIDFEGGALMTIKFSGSAASGEDSLRHVSLG